MRAKRERQSVMWIREEEANITRFWKISLQIVCWTVSSREKANTHWVWTTCWECSETFNIQGHSSSGKLRTQPSVEGVMSSMLTKSYSNLSPSHSVQNTTCPAVQGCLVYAMLPASLQWPCKDMTPPHRWWNQDSKYKFLGQAQVSEWQSFILTPLSNFFLLYLCEVKCRHRDQQIPHDFSPAGPLIKAATLCTELWRGLGV